MNDLTGKNILLVDDDDEFCLFVKECIEKERGTLHIAEHPSKIFEIINKSKPDLIILDLNFDNKLDFQTIRNDRGEDILKIRIKDKYLSDIPVLICSAENYAGTFIKVEKLGADDFIAKPLKKSSLIHKIKENLR